MIAGCNAAFRHDIAGTVNKRSHQAFFPSCGLTEMRAKNRSPRPTKSDGLHQQRRFHVPNDDSSGIFKLKDSAGC